MTSALALDLDWAGFTAVVDGLAEVVRADGPPTTVVGIVRGGLVPAVMLAHRLAVRDVRAVEITRTVGELPGGAKTAPRLVNPASLGKLGVGADVLLVDDVAGSGATVAAAAGLLAGAARVRRAVVVVNTVNWSAANSVAGEQVLDYVGCSCAGWVRFPWEVR